MDSILTGLKVVLELIPATRRSLPALSMDVFFLLLATAFQGR